MTGAQLARAIADVCSTKPDLDAKLAATLARWLKDTLGKLTTLDDYRRAAAGGNASFVPLYLSTLPALEVAKLAKKFDPHRPGLHAQSHEAQRSHILSLIKRQSEPTERAATRQPPMPFDAILALADPIRRHAELSKHTPVQLKKVIKEKQINGGYLSSKPSKTELVEHIQAALASGWPQARSILDQNKY
jgi:hypothetical protein